MVLAVILAACSSGSSSDSEKSSETTEQSPRGSTAQHAATTPEGALAAVNEYVKGQGDEYVGDCAAAGLPQDTGKWCSTLVSTDTAAGTETYDVGPVDEKPSKRVTVKRRSTAELTPGYQVGVSDGTVGGPQLLTREQLQTDVFITGNLVLDQAAGIGNGLADLPAGAPSGGTGGTGGNGDTGGTTPPPVITPDGGGSAAYPLPPGGIVVDDPTVEVGGVVAFKGSGCLAAETLQVLFDGQAIGTIASDATGAFAGSIEVPRGTAPGTHLIGVRGANCSFNATVVVAGNLAFTGSSSNTGTYVLAGVAAVVVGLVLVVGSRRRRHGLRGSSRSSP